MSAALASDHASAPVDERALLGAGPTPWHRVAGLAGALVLLVTVMVSAFVWPAVAGEPRDLPLGLVAPPEQATLVAGAIEEAQPGALEVTVLSDEAAARASIEARDVYGALVLTPEGARMLTAPAAGPAVATQLADVARALGVDLARQRDAEVVETVTVEPVVPLPTDDPRGAGFASAALPLVLASVATGAVAAFGVRGLQRRIALVAAAAVGGGLAVQAVVGAWLGVLTGNAWAQLGLVALAVAAVGYAIVGAHALVGRVGFVLVAATMVLLGNPLSAAASAPEILPAGWSELGQALPPGALVRGLRSIAYFDGAAAGAPVAVLGIWLAAGATLVGVALLRGRRPAQD